MLKKFALATLTLVLLAGMALAAPVVLSTSGGAQASTKQQTTVRVIPPAPLVKASPKIWQFQEGFEGSFLPAGWDTLHLNGAFAAFVTQVAAGTHPTCSPHGGTYMVKYNTYDAPTGNRMRLFTPPVAVGHVADSVTFWMTHDAQYNNADWIVIEVMVKPSGGIWGVWTAVDSFRRYDAAYPAGGGWGRHAVGLGTPVGDSVRLSFTCQAAYGNNIFLDDVAVGRAPLDHDLALLSIDHPTAAVVQPLVNIFPQVTIGNPGLNAETSFGTVVEMRDSTDAVVYGVQLNITSPDSLQPDSSRLLYYGAPFTPAAFMKYHMVTFHTLAGDMDNTNDTLHHYFQTFTRLAGTVVDANASIPLLDAVVTAIGPSVFYVDTTDSAGNYMFPEVAGGTYTITAEKAGYVTEIDSGVAVVDTPQTVHDLYIGYPVLSYGPVDSLYATLPWGAADSTTWNLFMQNTGTRDLHYSLTWPEAAKAAAGKAPVSLALDDGSRENDIGLGGTISMLWLNRFTPAAGEFPFILNEVQLYFSTVGLVSVGDSIVVLVYENTSGNTDPAVGSNLLCSYPTTVQAIDAWSSYVLPAPVALNGPGDVLIGVIGLKLPGTSYWPASLDQTATQQRSWAGWWNTASPPSYSPALPPDASWILIDTYFPGNWMVRGLGNTVPNAAWLDIDSPSGTISPYDYVTLNVTFNAAGLDSFTDWAASIRITTDAMAHDTTNTVPAYLHVLGMTGVAGNPVEQARPMAFGLKANYPNPAKGQTTFSFNLPSAQRYTLKVYNIAGQLMHAVDGTGRDGANTVAWDTGPIAGGVYLYTLSAGGRSATRKLVVVK